MLIENCPFIGNLSSHNPFLLTKMVSAILWIITPFLADISGTFLSHTLSLDKNDVNNPWTKRRLLFEAILTWGVVLQSGKSSMARVVVRNRWIMRTKKKEQKEKLIVMSCTWKIRLSLNENQESQIQKMCWKTAIIFFSYKDSLFGLGNYVWDKKWSSYIIPPLCKTLVFVKSYMASKIEV